MFKKILWAMDFSESSHHAGEQALRCAQCSEGTLYILAVVDPKDMPFILGEEFNPFADENRLQTQYEQRVLDQMKHELETLGETSVPVEFHIRVGMPWQAIIVTAQELGATLIVMGCSGRRRLTEVFLGSTTENVIKNAPCPVLVTR